jgi:phosphomannomutase/phosphoglucomutase
LDISVTVVREKLDEWIHLASENKLDRRLTAGLGLAGAVLVILTVWMLVQDSSRFRGVSEALSEGQLAVTQVGDVVRSLEQLLVEEQVQALAARAIADASKLGDLQSYLAGRRGEISGVSVFGPDPEAIDPSTLGPNGYAVLDMLYESAAGKNPDLQLHATLQPPTMVNAVRVTQGDQRVGFLVVGISPEHILSSFNPNVSELGFVRLTQYNGRQPATVLKEAGEPGRLGDIPDRLSVPGTLFRIEIPQQRHTGLLSGSLAIVLILLGLALAGASVFLFRLNAGGGQLAPARRPAPRPERAESRERALEGPVTTPAPETIEEVAEDEAEAEPEPEEPPPMHLRYDIAERRRKKHEDHAPVELSPGIFRAYDIRGVMYKTLDAGVTKQIGQAVGTMALEAGVGPVVVARDGRLSGPELVDGMLEGITSTGCDALDIDAVPTGVLYYAAHEFAKGTGVMITGSHNPPEYNGVKIMLGGDTLSGDQISGIYRRITEGEIRIGSGEVKRENVVPQYIERIAGDIQLDRPLRVVIDCGNGIGGVCAAEVLRAVGAEALALFDEVDGTFPNHHPDPSEPENLKDLIESVRLMDADLGLALDGDADRLGVVTLGGSIIYADRIMMLLAMDVLDRKPGATIIYDVKCTGHLAKVIEEAGGKPVMYKTGHSLIKTKMKEIGSPFAGEMSGHFFFGERWYGVDDGIYAAARLLEILAGAEAPPEAILNALPTSFSTPELKVQMQEGENHAFIEIFREKARFDGARINTIDGLRADFPDGWGLVRPSNTTPILVCRFDAETEQALERIKVAFRSQMLQINPDLDLPF